MTYAERRERRREIAEAVKAGRDPRELAQEHGVAWATVLNACREHGVRAPRTTSGRRPSASAFAILRELVERPDVDHFIAQRLGVRQSHVLYVRKTAREAGWKV